MKNNVIVIPSDIHSTPKSHCNYKDIKNSIAALMSDIWILKKKLTHGSGKIPGGGGGGAIEMFDASGLPGNFSHPVLISENN